MTTPPRFEKVEEALTRLLDRLDADIVAPHSGPPLVDALRLAVAEEVERARTAPPKTCVCHIPSPDPCCPAHPGPNEAAKARAEGIAQGRKEAWTEAAYLVDANFRRLVPGEVNIISAKADELRRLFEQRAAEARRGSLVGDSDHGTAALAAGRGRDE